MFDAIAILICWFRCTFRGFLSRFWSLCGAVQKICTNLYQSAPDKIHLSSDFTNKFEELNFPNTENPSIDQQRCQEVIMILQYGESTSTQSYLKKDVFVNTSSTQRLIFVRVKSEHCIYCSLKLLTFQSPLWRAPLEGLQSVAIKVSSCYIILASKMDWKFLWPFRIKRSTLFFRPGTYESRKYRIENQVIHYFGGKDQPHLKNDGKINHISKTIHRERLMACKWHILFIWEHYMQLMLLDCRILRNIIFNQYK